MTYKFSRTLLFSLLCAGFFLAPAAPVFAQEEASEQQTIENLNTEIEKDFEDASKARKAAAEKAYNKISELMLSLPDKERQHFSLIYSNYNFIQTVHTVQQDVGNAIEKCGENNPDMKERLDERYKTWNGAVDPLMKEAKANLDNMVLAQNYAPKAKMEEIFKAIDATRAASHNQIEKIPVTTPEACTYLAEKMDETQEQMTGLLRNTLISYPQKFNEENAPVEETAPEPSAQ